MDYLGNKLIDTDNDGLFDSVDPFPFDKLNGYSELTNLSGPVPRRLEGRAVDFSLSIPA